MTESVERRENIKLRLEYFKLAASLIGVGTLLIAVLQWVIANQIADQTVYQRMNAEWTEHLRVLVQNPKWRPYFDGKQEIAPDAPDAEAILALADIRLELMEAILTYATLRGSKDVFNRWNVIAARAFLDSPTLCKRMRHVSTSFPRLDAYWLSACRRRATYD